MDSANKSQNLRSMEASFMERSCTMVIPKLALESSPELASNCRQLFDYIYLNLALQGQYLAEASSAGLSSPFSPDANSSVVTRARTQNSKLLRLDL
ncbi:hypothetical protein BHM03_00012134 [Ensete ventricosum]|nr:hypothetical protein BHM03_00012134 [Ensete ventricosum]